MIRIFLIPGMGADRRIYSKIKLPKATIDGIPYQPVYIDWFDPNDNDTLISYSQRIVKQYNILSNDVVIGNSLGGMMAVEIAKATHLRAVILISSIKTIGEAPWYYSLFKILPIYRIIPDSLLLNSGKLVRFILGKMDDVQENVFADMLRNSSPRFLKWSMRAALYWKNKTIPPHLYHIVGNKDLIFNYKRIKDAAIINGGTHIMIADRAAEINAWLESIL